MSGKKIAETAFFPDNFEFISQLLFKVSENNIKFDSFIESNNVTKVSELQSIYKEQRDLTLHCLARLTEIQKVLLKTSEK